MTISAGETMIYALFWLVQIKKSSIILNHLVCVSFDLIQFQPNYLSVLVSRFSVEQQMNDLKLFSLIWHIHFLSHLSFDVVSRSSSSRPFHTAESDRLFKRLPGTAFFSAPSPASIKSFRKKEEKRLLFIRPKASSFCRVVYLFVCWWGGWSDR